MGRRVLITGASESGKSHLAQKMAADFQKAKWPVIIYTSTIDDEWAGCERHDDLDTFRARMRQLMAHAEKQGRPLRVAVFIDEADEVFSLGQKENYWLLKKGRHYFDFLAVLCQRPKMVAPTVRGQCAELIAFSLKDEDAAELSRDFVADLRDLPAFRQGEYYRVFWRDREKVAEKIDGFAK